MLPQVTQQLIATVRNPASTDADRQAAAQAFFNAAGRASRTDANAALAALAGHLSTTDLSRAGFLALVCGALVEQGCDPQPLAQPLTTRLQSLLEAAAALADACEAQIPKPAGKDQDPAEAFETVRQQVAPSMPRENAAWEALRHFWPPAIAIF